MRGTRGPVPVERRKQLSENVASAMERIEKNLGTAIERAITTAKKNPGTQVGVCRAPALGMQQVMCRHTRCVGIGPFRWARNARDYWFLTYEPTT